MHMQTRILPGSPQQYSPCSTTVDSGSSKALPFSDIQDESCSMIQYPAKRMNHTIKPQDSKIQDSYHTVPLQKHNNVSNTLVTLPHFISSQSKGATNIDSLEQQLFKLLKEFQEKQIERHKKLEQYLSKANFDDNKKE